MTRVLLWLSIVLGLVVIAGFTTFAYDELRAASERQLALAAGVAPPDRVERAREREHGTVREAISDTNDVLLLPFRAAGEAFDDPWLQRGLPALIGLLVYGLGLSVLSRWSVARPRTVVRRHVI